MAVKVPIARMRCENDIRESNSGIDNKRVCDEQRLRVHRATIRRRPMDLVGSVWRGAKRGNSRSKMVRWRKRDPRQGGVRQKLHQRPL